MSSPVPPDDMDNLVYFMYNDAQIFAIYESVEGSRTHFVLNSHYSCLFTSCVYFFSFAFMYSIYTWQSGMQWSQCET
jgi:hypothetical protein